MTARGQIDERDRQHGERDQQRDHQGSESLQAVEIRRQQHSLPLVIPLLIPLAVLAIPFVDLSLAVIRRVGHGHSPFAPDKQHLHHRMLELGHTHRRAVLCCTSGRPCWPVGVTFSITHRPWTVIVALIGLATIGFAVSVIPRLSSSRRVGAHR